jgi:Ca2+/Na+ antiporter
MNESTKSSSSWGAVVLFAVFTVISQLVLLYPLRGHDTVPRSIRFAFVGVAAIVVLHAFARRNRWNQKLAMILFLLIVVPVYVLAWVNHASAARGQELWVPLEGFPAIFLVLAVLIPGAYWVNAILMVGFVVEAVIIWRVLDVPHVETAVVWHEPWVSVTYVVIAAGLLLFRIAHDHMHRELERSRSRAEMLEQVARIFLTIRDRTNTPLQTLVLAVAVLRAKYPEAVELTELLSRSTDRIIDTNALLSRFQSRVTWPQGDLMTDEELLWLIEET